MIVIVVIGVEIGFAANTMENNSFDGRIMAKKTGKVWEVYVENSFIDCADNIIKQSNTKFNFKKNKNVFVANQHSYTFDNYWDARKFKLKVNKECGLTAAKCCP